MSTTYLSAILEIPDRTEIARSVAVMSLGLCTAIVDGSVSLAEAELRLFNPRTLARLEALDLPGSIVDLVHLGTELEDVQRLLPDRFNESLAEIEALALAFLRGESERAKELV
jgi:hypothetical protein